MSTYTRLMSIALMLSYSCSYADIVTPYYSIRSQGVDAARELAGWTQHVNLYDMNKLYGSFAVTAEYTRSFNAKQIAESLFGDNACYSKNGATVMISGSHVANRGATDWLADYFYLPPDFQSTLNFTPRIENAILDFNFYLGFDEWLCGLFFRMHFPVVWTRWNLNFCETINAPGVLAYDPGYFSCSAIPRDRLLTSFADYASGCAPSVFTDSSFSVTFDPLCFAKFNRCAHTKAGVAELAFIVGYNFIDDEDYHLGVGLKAAAPTGNAPKADYLFEPIVGNGKHWELGVHITGHSMLWRSEDEESSLGLFVDINITHLFNTGQRRTFDLKGAPLSRYMLAERLNTPAAFGLAGNTASGITAGSVAATASFGNEYTPIANITTQKIQVGVGAQCDLAAQLTYAYGGFNWDLGYNFWGRSCQRFNHKCRQCTKDCGTRCTNCPAFTANTWAKKGDAFVYGVLLNSAADGVLCRPLSATQSQATLTRGLNHANQATAAPILNRYIDNPQFAVAQDNAGTLEIITRADIPTVAGASNSANQVDTSIQPVFIESADIHYVGTSGVSQKIYTHFSYNWIDCDEWIPYVGIGGFAEFGQGGKNCNNPCDTTNTSCGSTCLKEALSQWGIWAKFGVSFN